MMPPSPDETPVTYTLPPTPEPPRPGPGTVIVMPVGQRWMWNCTCGDQGYGFDDERECRDSGFEHQKSHGPVADPVTPTEAPHGWRIEPVPGRLDRFVHATGAEAEIVGHEAGNPWVCLARCIEDAARLGEARTLAAEALALRDAPGRMPAPQWERYHVVIAELLALLREDTP